MKFGSNREGVKWIEITKALLLFKPYIKIEFWKVKTGIKKAFGLRLMRNCRLRVHKDITNFYGL